MEEQELEKYKSQLIKEKEHLFAEVQELQDRSLNESQSEVSGESSYETHQADSGTATFERERDLSLERNVEDLLERVDAALRKIENGEFGLCESCGRAISEDRLEALPYANLCIECKEREEKSW